MVCFYFLLIQENKNKQGKIARRNRHVTSKRTTTHIELLQVAQIIKITDLNKQQMYDTFNIGVYMKTKTLKLEIPSDIILSLNENEQQFLKQMKLYTALFLFLEQKLSIGKAAQLSGMDIYNFMMEAGKHNVPVINYDTHDLRQELDILKEC